MKVEHQAVRGPEITIKPHEEEKEKLEEMRKQMHDFLDYAFDNANKISTMNTVYRNLIPICGDLFRCNVAELANKTTITIHYGCDINENEFVEV